ncbi:MAG TPA: universal stress protein [Myxococcales bacterium]|nr:universal stress protein [Myxococcales bacterium]
MKKIVVGVDGSPESRLAAEQAAELARSMGARMLATYVVTLPVAVGPEPLELHTWEVAERKYASELLAKVAIQYRRSGIDVETVMPSGAPAETLAEMARSEDVQLVVVGHRGRGAIKRALLGSVADRLVQISPKPVLVAR